MTGTSKQDISDRKATVISAVIRFGPATQKELAQLVPEYDPHTVKTTLESLLGRGYVTIQGKDTHKYDYIHDDDVLEVNTNPFKMPRNDQKVLPWEDNPSREEALAKQLPDAVETSPTITLELTEDQTEIFEKMRADVNRTTNSSMSKEEFMDWVLREARRFTEV